MKDIWYIWPDGFMCPEEEELAVHLQYRSDDIEKVEVIDYDEYFMPSNWISV